MKILKMITTKANFFKVVDASNVFHVFPSFDVASIDGLATRCRVI